jgi:hypothetical protein
VGVVLGVPPQQRRAHPVGRVFDRHRPTEPTGEDRSQDGRGGPRGENGFQLWHGACLVGSGVHRSVGGHVGHEFPVLAFRFGLLVDRVDPRSA